MGIIIYDCTFKEDLNIRFVVNEIHPLKFIFCEQGRIGHRFENDNMLHAVDVMENIIVASSNNNGHVLVFYRGIRTKMNSLEINWKRFAETKDCELSNLNEKLEVLFMDISAKNTFYYHGDYSVKMADLFIEINNFSSQNFLINFFMEGSAYQILTLQILQYMDDLAHLGHKKVLRKSEIGQIEKAASIINNDIQDFSTVNKLASDVGLNPNKLQEGFKELYDTTVNNYLHNRRLDLATNLLKNTEMSISEIVFKLGLSSKSYFSKIIKERYGISPSTLRKKRSE